MAFSFNYTQLIDLRQNAGLTASDVAKGVDVHKSQITRLEKGIYKNPKIKTVSKIARFFNVKIAVFRSGSAL